MTIREVRPEDGPGVMAVFNHFIRESFAAYGEEELPLARFDDFVKAARVFLILEEDEEVAGFGFVKPYRPGAAFRHTGMLTYFILPHWTGQGWGSRMLRALMRAGQAQGVTQWLAHISSKNEPSLAFHRKHGFTEVGRLRSVGVKFNEPYDIVWMQKERAMGEGQ